MLPPPQPNTPCSRPGPAARILFFALLGLAGGCGGDGGIEPPTLHPTKLALVTQPSPQGQSRVNLIIQPVVELQDEEGTAVPQAGVPVTVSIATGGGSLTGTTTANTSGNGRATFSELAIGGTAGPRTLTFSSPNLVPVTSSAIELSAGAAATIAVNSGDGQNAGIGSAVPLAPSVMVTDADNNRVSGVPVMFQVTAGGGTVEPTTPISTDASGIATVTSWVLGGSPGPNSLTASIAGPNGPSAVFNAMAITGTSTITGTVTITGSLLPARTDATYTAAQSTIPLLPRTKPSRPLRGTLHDLPTPLPLRRGQSHQQQEYTPNELIVTFRARSIGAPPMGSLALGSRSTAATAGAAIRGRLLPHLAAEHSTVTGVSPVILAARIRVPDGADLTRIAAAMLADPAVARVERNGMVRLDGERAARPVELPTSSNDPLYPFQAWHYGMIDAPEAWSITTGSSGVLVAVVDDGIRFDHPAIAANLTSDGYDFVSNIPIDVCSGGTTLLPGDGDGYDPDPTNPAAHDFDFDRGCVAGLLETGNHGLHVAGTIGAVGDDGLGVSGINWTVRIRPVRVLGVDGEGTAYDVAQGVLYAAGLPADDGAGGVVQAATGARIINLSLSGQKNFAVLDNAVTAASDAGALIVAAAGNTGTSVPQFPAADPEVLSVSAVGPDRQLASYSSFGSTVDITAPGGDIGDGDISFGVVSTAWNFVNGQPVYASYNGTSMAAPHVSGVAALILAANPGLSASQLRSRLLDFAVDAGPAGTDSKYGAGIVNARNSLAQNLAPPRALQARLYDALTGSTLQTVAVAEGGSYSFTSVTKGTYNVFAGQDESADQLIGLPGRRWGAFGGTATPGTIHVNEAGTQRASFSIGLPQEDEPNGVLADANVLPVGGYLRGTTDPTDVDLYRVLIPLAGQYTFETSAVDGACGFGLEEDTLLGLYDASGALISSNDDINPDALEFCARITTTLSPGIYHINVQGYVGGRYQVQARAGD